MMGNPAGRQAMWTAPDGSVHILYEYNDRGRGPQTTSILKLDARGALIAETVTGHDYLKSPVRENFAQVSGVAHWKSDSEQGDKKVTTPALYVAANGAPAELALLARTALSNGAHMALLPEGEATVARVSQLNLESSGKKKRVTLYAISGLDFSPAYVWLDDRSAFFAVASRWMTVIPEGWKGTAKTLQAAEDEAAQVRSASLAAKLAHAVPNGIAFTHARVFDAPSAAILDDQTVSLSETASARSVHRARPLRRPELKSLTRAAKCSSRAMGHARPCRR